MMSLKGHCYKCGHDFVMSNEICPECFIKFSAWNGKKNKSFIKIFKHFTWMFLFFAPICWIIGYVMGFSHQFSFMLGFICHPIIINLASYCDEKF